MLPRSLSAVCSRADDQRVIFCIGDDVSREADVECRGGSETHCRVEGLIAEVTTT
jgi:hypothetical protein